MADNTTKKLLDLAGLQTFTGLMKQYVDTKVEEALENGGGGDTGDTGTSELTGRVEVLETTVGNTNSGLVKDVADLKTADIEVLQDAKDYTDAYKTEVSNTYATKVEQSTLETSLTSEINKKANSTDVYNKSEVDSALGDKADKSVVEALEETVGDNASGLVQKVNFIQGELDGLSGGAGSITTQITNALAGLDVEDDAVEGQYVSSVSEENGKIDVKRAALPNYDNTYEAKGAAATAEQNAKDYAGGLDTAMDARVKVLEAIDHDAYQTADTEVLQDAKDYTDGKDSAMDVRVDALETTVGDTDSGLVKEVADLKAADTEVLQDAKDYTDGKDSAMDVRVDALETTVGDANSGLVKDITANRADIEKLKALFEWGTTEE